jgi:SAM-dependent methyltransferase
MRDLKKIFTEIYESNSWTSSESRSGLGSELLSTETIRKELPEVFKKFNIKSVLDIPCGDFNWMNNVDLKEVHYIGADIVENMIEDNKNNFKDYEFKVLDITEDDLPEVDLIFARDILGHFDYENIEKTIKNIIRSGSKYLLTTSFTKWEYNIDIKNGDWRPINLMLKPFLFKPIYLINENCFEGDFQYNDKCLILFDLNKLYCGLK